MNGLYFKEASLTMDKTDDFFVIFYSSALQLLNRVVSLKFIRVKLCHILARDSLSLSFSLFNGSDFKQMGCTVDKTYA